MKMKSILGTAGMLLISYNSAAFDPNTAFYDAKICTNCNYSEAKVIARSFEPAVNCSRGPTDPWEDVCSASTRRIVVKNLATGAVYGFSHGYNFQGGAYEDMQRYVEPINNLPSDVNLMLQHAINASKNIQDAVQQVESTLSLDLLTSLSLNSNESLALNSCTNSPSYAAFKASRSSSAFSKVQRTAQQKYDSSAVNRSSYTLSRFTSLGFTAGAGSVGMQGSFEHLAQSNSAVTRYVSDSDVPHAENQVGYVISLKSGGVIELTLDTSRTRFEGLTLASLSANFTHASEVSSCLAAALDETIPKVVYSPDGATTGSGPSFNNIPLVSPNGGNGRGGDGQQCIHRYYDRNRNELFAFLGACP
ncbi:hypothetical protein [Pseudoalteromonas piscicida]|uniref:Uncharacterized protein n=1 Tax=Pseudoalteromonas piscicida TaxID=43662 RepID=A0AAD0RJ47_PSEO7|nr:hypothetical protein [Pseudoalteromonas piscicida]ASD68662.1 hypothetical protein B1L02_17660 [Pseudoalteromonas piscicida]AXR03720.1 hypothetical protein D0511_17735 [Pseudoalteromonas piscicida]